MSSRHRARELALKALYSWELNKSTQFSDIISIEYDDTSGKSFDFANRLYSGTLKKLTEIDEILNQKITNWDIERVNKIDLSILRLSLYSLVVEKDTPRSVVIDEAINLAKEYCSDKSYKFINGILDSIDQGVVL